jgi:hypothetical protein
VQSSACCAKDVLFAIWEMPTGRFFHTTLLGGFLHVRGIPDWGPWNDARIEYTQESFVDAILRPGTGDRKVRTPEELQAALAEPRGAARRERSGYMRACWKKRAVSGRFKSAELTSPQSPGH